MSIEPSANATSWCPRRAIQCEGLYLAQLYDPFSWTVDNVRGRIAHRAIERLIHGRYESSPVDLVERAIARCATDESNPDLAEFLSGLDDDDRHDLTCNASDQVTKFAIDWPRIPTDWLPRVESSANVPLFDGAIRLRARADLALGKPQGSEARVFVTDFKSGAERENHIDDLRFYSLVEALVRGTPPYRVGTYYLDSGRFVYENVSESTLETAVRRLVEGTRRIRNAQLDPDNVRLNPSPLCLYCSRGGTCSEGQDWISTH